MTSLLAPTDESTVERIQRYLNETRPATPCLVVDVDAVRRRYQEMRHAMPGVAIHYAVKANPAPEIVEALVAQGSSFDVASTAEIELCLRSGADPAMLSYGNTIKKARDIAYAYRVGVRTFVTDSEPDLHAIADRAPSSKVLVRIANDGHGSALPFGPKFGCRPERAVELLRQARRLGLNPIGLAFHPGSQQLNTAAWGESIAIASRITTTLAAEGIDLTTLDLGGGFPATYRQNTPRLVDYGAAIATSVARYFGRHAPKLMIEPGRAMVAEAGMIRSEVVLVTARDTDHGRRWVYLDIGKFGGLAETQGEAITYAIQTSADGDRLGPVAIAGPTCDSEDVLYQHTDYRLPNSLAAGDFVDLLSAGAYTASYAAVEFNGFAPLRTHCI
ncbi:type III PLP-dependent enzyme [Mycobacterium sp. C31M]